MTTRIEYSEGQRRVPSSNNSSEHSSSSSHEEPPSSSTSSSSSDLWVVQEGQPAPEPTRNLPPLQLSPQPSARDVLHMRHPEDPQKSIRRGFTPAPSVASSDFSGDEEESFTLTDDEVQEILGGHHHEGEDDTLQVNVEFHNDNDGSVVTVQVPEGTKITEAATQAGVYIPTLCHHPRLPPAGKCGVCVVAVEKGPTPTQLACATVCRMNDDGSPMKVHVHGSVLNGLANAALRRNLEYSMEHQTKRFHSNNQFANCGSLEIEDLANYLTKENKMETKSIIYDPALCIGCDRCVRACDNIQGIKVLENPPPSSSAPTVGVAQAPACMTTKAGRPLSETDCISCGQCTIFCPTGAIKEVDHTPAVVRALLDPNKVVVVQMAPSVRVTLAEAFGGNPGDCTTGKLVGAAKACGFDFCFDTLLAADLTIMEEANELLHRIEIAQKGSPEEKAKAPLPMFTSCCPGWVNLVEQSYPELIPNLSTCRSPMAMLSSVIRNHWWPNQVKRNAKYRHYTANPNQADVDQDSLFVVAVMPCTAKKDEMARMSLYGKNGRPETDAVLTVREMARLMELRNVAKRNDYQGFVQIPELRFDNPFGESTGAAVIFGATGGVMEAALRTAADVLSGEDLQDFTYHQVRGMAGIKEATVQLGPKKEIGLSVAVCNQMRNVREFLAQIESSEKQYHFIEIMTCPGGCIGGGGLPQSRDPDVITQRMQSIYSIDERCVKRKAHDNPAVQCLYKDFLIKPLGHRSHHLLHTTYNARPRQPPVLLKAPAPQQSIVMEPGDEANSIYIVYGTQSGTSAQAAKDIKIELQQFIGRSKLKPEPNVSLIAGNAMKPDALASCMAGSMASIFVSCTYGEGEMPEMIAKAWEFFESSDDALFADKNLKYAVFGLCSSRYDVGDQYNRAARRFDRRLEELGGQRMVEVGAGDDQNSEGYRGALDPWLEQLMPKLFATGAAKTSLLDPPEPLFKINLAPSSHSNTNFRPLPPCYHFISLESFKSCVSEGYERPAGVFNFSLKDTGLTYKCGDHLAILPRNPTESVDSILALYGETLQGSQLLTIQTMDVNADCPFPKVLSIRELLTQYLDLCGRPSRQFFKLMFMFARGGETRKRLRSLFERDSKDSISQEEFDTYTDQNTYADVLCEFAKEALPPFEYLLSMIPLNTPRFYSIASSPLDGEEKLELLVVKNMWNDSAKKARVGLNTKYMFEQSKPGDLFAVQIHTGILQPPEEEEDLDTPVIMLGLGAGLAPFVGFLQHRQGQMKKLRDEALAEGSEPKKLGPATLYFGTRHRAHDYYLEDYFQECLKDGSLTAIYTAFSRDGLSPSGKKQYIYNAITENPLGFAKGLELDKAPEESKSNKARCYYCGSANGIPEAIQDSMMEALVSKDGLAMRRERAKEYMDLLVNIDKRFHSECF